MPSSEGSAPGQRRRRRARVDRDPFVFRELHRLRVQHLRAGFGQLLRFFVRQRADSLCVGDDARIRRVHAVDIRTDLAVFGAERGGHRDGGGVAAAAAERRDFAAVRHALVAGDDDDFAARELVLDAVGPDLDDARVHVAIVGDDAGLAAGEADGVAAQLADGDREQRHRDALAGGEQHVELAPIGVGGHLLGEREEIVGGVAHRGDHDDDVVALAAGAHHALGHLLHAGDVRDAGSAVLLDYDRHGFILRL